MGNVTEFEVAIESIGPRQIVASWVGEILHDALSDAGVPIAQVHVEPKGVTPTTDLSADYIPPEERDEGDPPTRGIVEETTQGLDERKKGRLG